MATSECNFLLCAQQAGAGDRCYRVLLRCKSIPLRRCTDRRYSWGRHFKCTQGLVSASNVFFVPTDALISYCSACPSPLGSTVCPGTAVLIHTLSDDAIDQCFSTFKSRDTSRREISAAQSLRAQSIHKTISDR